MNGPCTVMWFAAADEFLVACSECLLTPGFLQGIEPSQYFFPFGILRDLSLNRATRLRKHIGFIYNGRRKILRVDIDTGAVTVLMYLLCRWAGTDNTFSPNLYLPAATLAPVIRLKTGRILDDCLEECGRSDLPLQWATTHRL